VSVLTTITSWLLGETTSPGLTAGDVRAALTALPSLGSALTDIVNGTATLSDAEVIGEDALAVASLADPALVPALTVASQLLPVALALVASGTIHGDPHPIQDGQTTGTNSAR
jgi:hypothetical protein